MPADGQTEAASGPASSGLTAVLLQRWLGPSNTLPPPTGSGSQIPMTCEFQIFLAGPSIGTFWNSRLFSSAPGVRTSAFLFPTQPPGVSPTLPGPASSCCHLPFPGNQPSPASEFPPCHILRASTCTAKAPPFPRGPTTSCNVSPDMSGGDTFKYACTRTPANNVKCHFKKWVK